MSGTASWRAQANVFAHRESEKLGTRQAEASTQKQRRCQVELPLCGDGMISFGFLARAENGVVFDGLTTSESGSWCVSVSG